MQLDEEIEMQNEAGEVVSNPVDSPHTRQSEAPTSGSSPDSPTDKQSEAAADSSADDEDGDLQEESEDEDSESENDSDDASIKEATASTEPSSTPPVSDGAIAKASEEKDDRSAIEREPYDFDKCTVQIAIQLLPASNDGSERSVILGVRSHLDAPILRAIRYSELGALPPVVSALLDALKGELPAREFAARESYERDKLEKQKRKAQLSRSTATSVKHSKRSTKGRSLSNAPTDSASSAERRPRPDVKVSTNAQRQPGLF